MEPVFDWLRRHQKRTEPARPPLRGAPPVRRQKSYSAESGYAYVYQYAGLRQLNLQGEAVTEYVFEVSAGAKNAFAVSVNLRDSVVATWQYDHGRELSGSERYAVAKMALRQAFDERPSPAEMREPVDVTGAQVAAILSLLGRD